MNLNEVAGIVITEDGIAHPFGVSDEICGSENNKSHEEYFSKEIASQSWFKKLNIDFDPKNLYYQIAEMTSFNLTFILNASSVSHNKNDVYTYVVFAPQQMSQKTKEYFSKHYLEFKNLIDRDKAFFQADTFDDGNYQSMPISNLDEFYESMNIEKNLKILK